MITLYFNGYLFVSNADNVMKTFKSVYIKILIKVMNYQHFKGG